MTTSISSIWIIGLSSAGKSTIAKRLADRLQTIGRASVIVDGTEIRDLFDKKLGYDPQSRRKQTDRIKKLASWISGNGVLPIVAIIHPFEDDREVCRREMPGYFEIFLDCDIKTLTARDNKNLYMPAVKGEKKHVVGIDIPYEQPKNADLVIDSANSDADEILELIWTKVLPHLQEDAA